MQQCCNIHHLYLTQSIEESIVQFYMLQKMHTQHVPANLLARILDNQFKYMYRAIRNMTASSQILLCMLFIMQTQ